MKQVNLCNFLDQVSVRAKETEEEMVVKMNRQRRSRILWTQKKLFGLVSCLSDRWKHLCKCLTNLTFN